ncbi:hypothetical protein H6P81_017832 [Aristolochia fimbriata]|uniref:Large ribosomal subunit protein bL32m n=1 Tax=Aristolochia fimbriata TaxID=158543 RepID=A0AAV7E3K3_ARIFI|nr:hypothetical protein H6P81_017832 [Aristolochia fimbriata]
MRASLKTKTFFFFSRVEELRAASREAFLMSSLAFCGSVAGMAMMLGRRMGSLGHRFFSARWTHTSLPAPLQTAIEGSIAAPAVLPEFDGGVERKGIDLGGSMELMAVPKKKISRHKKGIRNGPKALKPTPVIVRCKGCGRVKLQHFYCCSGDRGSTDRNAAN